MPITNVIDQIKRDEGLRLKPYVDTVGKTTIGYGRNLTDDGITQYEAESFLANDIARTKNYLNGSLPWWTTLDDVRQGVLINLCFNIGITSLLKFVNFLDNLKSGNWNLAGLALLNSRWAIQVGMRAERLAKQVETGVWQ